MKPPMIPHQGKAIDTVNFRNVKESQSSVDMGNGFSTGGGKTLNGNHGILDKDEGGGLLGVPGGVAGLKGVPLDSGLATPVGEGVPDPFEDFNSVTLHHDGEHDHR